MIKEGACKIYHPDRGLIIEAQMSANRMFKVHAHQQSHSQFSPTMTDTCFLANVSETTRLWHRRYGHLNYKSLKSLEHKKMVTGLPKLTATSEICNDCLIGKHHRDPIPTKSLSRAGRILDLIHADICGPIKPASFGNKKYILCFIDDYSRKSWIYLLADKSEAFSNFKCFVKLVSNKTGLPVKCLRMDRGE